MAKSRPSNLLLLFFTIILCAHVIQGSRTQFLGPNIQSLRHSSASETEYPLQGGFEQWNSRRLMIGSTAPTCTYNECRGCKYKCRAEQVPVEGNDPINSAYHYRCVCHRGKK
ncbi:EPIDERMAL PATTERNING FACTOR-like protein 9 [Actinidia eriantha]|uniref:EPIDERMAL PATTERNING FACTOR-like protein 9 n=1 Tax=Actinidia eriantha TaxID=165200 RepID=UPI00258EB1FC|nr:EPIDERMAL PATTERNING FACTOR-like protein 9 [Actinidia eriantha]